MMDFAHGFASLQYWHWLSAGLLFLVLEFFLPGAVFLWLGLGGLLTGVLTWLFPALSGQWQCVLFASLSVLSFVFWRKFGRPRRRYEPVSTLNRRGQNLVGRSLVLSEPIVAGEGRVRVDDTLWRVLGPELPAGARVRVIAAEGLSLRVEAL